jgi:Lipocalin-like domain
MNENVEVRFLSWNVPRPTSPSRGYLSFSKQQSSFDPAQRTDHMKDITGTWRLVTTRGRTDTGEPMRAPYGRNPMGVVEFQSNGRMIAVLCDGRPKLPMTTPIGSTIPIAATTMGKSWYAVDVA